MSASNGGTAHRTVGQGTSAIEWTEKTWNPVTGCSKVSPGCDNCYAETLSLRFGWSKKPWTLDNAAENVVLHPERLEQPLKWRKPAVVFVNSMSDMFHQLVPWDFLDRIWDVMAVTPQHTYQILTKRPREALAYRENMPPLPNVWLGVSIESWRFNWRADVLRRVPAAIRFISAEPLLDTLYGPRPLDLTGIDWLIVGGESGPHHRPMERTWALELLDASRKSGTAFFLKQWGGRTPKARGRMLDGRTWDEMPAVAA